MAGSPGRQISDDATRGCSADRATSNFADISQNDAELKRRKW
jgi:hypothetical protein